jgi:hypothetical protein
MAPFAAQGQNRGHDRRDGQHSPGRRLWRLERESRGTAQPDGGDEQLVAECLDGACVE